MTTDSNGFKAQVQIGIDQINRGEYVEEPDMDALVNRLLRTLPWIEDMFPGEPEGEEVTTS